MRRERLLYGPYERRLLGAIRKGPLPTHIGVMLDGNRRWAQQAGHEIAEGHRRGASKINELLRWCDEIGIRVITLYLLSTDNLRRDPSELTALLQTIEQSITAIAEAGPYRIHPIGALDLLPVSTAEHIRAVAQSTQHNTGSVVNVAIGYGGRHEITNAVRTLLAEHAELGTSLAEIADTLEPADIERHLYTSGQPDPDLVIRTSGEQRLSGFLLWQSANTELYFCEAYWPDFRRVDLLRALRSYAKRERRFGT